MAAARNQSEPIMAVPVSSTYGSRSETGIPIRHSNPAYAGAHQFRTRNDLIRTQQTHSNLNENAAKSAKLIDFRSLITVWLQVRALPGPPAKSMANLVAFHFKAS
jgi:hypothetical protein